MATSSDHLHEHLIEINQKVDAIDRKLNQLLSDQRDIRRRLRYITTQEYNEMADLSRLTAAVEANTSVDESANVLLSQLAQLIRDNSTDPAALEALASQLEASNSGLAEAVVANTPAA